MNILEPKRITRKLIILPKGKTNLVDYLIQNDIDPNDVSVEKSDLGYVSFYDNNGETDEEYQERLDEYYRMKKENKDLFDRYDALMRDLTDIERKQDILYDASVTLSKKISGIEKQIKQIA